MTRSILLPLYRLASAGFEPFCPLYLRWRANLGQEDHSRFGERLGRPSLARPEGRLAWLHGASATEILALLPVVEKLGSAGFSVVVSTSRLTSGALAALRLPPKTLHQFAPLDIPKFMARFLDHWRPDIVLIAQSEIWPNLIVETSRRKIPLALVNARLSARAFLVWRKMPGFFRALLRRVDLCLAQTDGDAERFKAFGAARAQATGNALYDFAPAPVDAAALARLVARLGARPAWAALSTYPGEEEIILDVHRRVARHFPDLVTIILPRHAKRGLEIALRAAKLGLTARALSSDREGDALPEIYLAGTLGEAGLFYRSVSAVFLGKSLCSGGGINPIEPAKLGCAILHGPDVADFAEAYSALDGAGGAGRVFDEETLAAELALLLFDAAELRAMGRAAADTVERLGGASTRIMQAIEPYVEHAMVSRSGMDA
ncbi:3-deoxy-D-manno-octulosonic acid transferase [Methylocapsa aurea]|uniref:3-deoxy-D-manno-octulosonic acid transferase n=1 Tax=Methylocapsa aurea TaxID=663610 RepID=UPI0005625F87|nr:glycosyltransferase N-terminal domain-containing protein [Methylocapsa aurea]